MTQDYLNLQETKVDIMILDNLVQWARTIDFSALRTPTDRYSKQQTLDHSRTKLLTACAIHYDLHVPSIYRYLGGEYTGSYLKVDQTMAALHKYGCPIQTMQEVQRVMAVGCPNYLVAEDTRSNFLDYYRYGNHITIAQNMSKVMKTMNKEDKHSYRMTLPSIFVILQ